MKTGLKIAWLLLLVMLLFLPLQSASAGDGTLSGQVYFGQSFTLKSGETMDGDLLVIGGSATIEKGATVNGSTVVVGGTLTLQGTVNGDAVVTGGSVSLAASAHVTGNLTTVSSTLDRADGSLVDGEVYNTATSWVNNGQTGQVPLPAKPIPPVVPMLKLGFQPFAAIANAFSGALLVALLAMGLMLFLAPHADRVAHAVIAQPLTAGGLGLLTIVMVPVALLALGLLSVLIITIVITVPLIIVLAVALGMAALFGWISIGYEIGQRLTRALHQNWHPAFSAGLGVFALQLVANGISLFNAIIPAAGCVTWVLPSLVGLLGLGGVILTRFGTQAVEVPVESAAVIPAQPAG